ncbi:MAG: phasin family protein [Actinomycetota bacterium]
MSERRSELKAVAANEEMPRGAERDIMQMTARMVDGWTQVNSRLMSIAQTSMRHNLDAAEELRQCQSPKDFMDMQFRLARQAYDDYMDEARKLSELVVKVSSEALGHVPMPK